MSTDNDKDTDNDTTLQECEFEEPGSTFDIEQTEEEMEEEAKSLGLISVPPLINELQLDIDAKFYLLTFHKNVVDTLARNGYHIIAQLYTKSKSGNVHVYLRLDQHIDARTRIFLQLALGSDKVREILSWLRDPVRSVPSVLFETPAEHARVIAWRNGILNE